MPHPPLNLSPDQRDQLATLLGWGTRLLPLAHAVVHDASGGLVAASPAAEAAPPAGLAGLRARFLASEEEFLSLSDGPLDMCFARLPVAGTAWVMSLWGECGAAPPQRLGDLPAFARIVALACATPGSDRRSAQEDAAELAAAVFTHSREAILIADRHGRIIRTNAAFERITGYAQHEVLGQKPRVLQSADQGRGFYAAMSSSLAERGYWEGELWNRRKNGSLYAELLTITAVSSPAGEIAHYVAQFSDITHLKRHASELEKMANYDVLTKLPNRRLLHDRLQQAMAAVRRGGGRLALAYIDLDGFKSVNDLHGHAAGDLLLRHISSCLAQGMRQTDTLCRLGGDEFVAVLGQLQTEEEVLPLVRRLVEACAIPCQLEEGQVQVSASIGVALYARESDTDPDLLLRQADHAMYEAKVKGRNQYCIFDPVREQVAISHSASVAGLREALRRDQFVLFFQPVLDLRSGRIVAAEALLRWRRGDGVIVMPGDFLPQIEQDALIVQIGDWVIDAALATLEQWQSQGLDLVVSVNVAARQLVEGSFSEQLRAHLRRHPSVDPARLRLEIIESAALDDLDRATAVMRDCHQLGVTFALDDFGTGYSSLAYLKRLPAAQLKIDQSFVRDVLADASNLAILESVIGLGRSFGMRVVAEGVETAEHAALLLSLGCDLAQGYGIARPLPVGELLPFLRGYIRPDALTAVQSIVESLRPLVAARTEECAWLKNVLTTMSLPEVEEYGVCRLARWIAAQPVDEVTRALAHSHEEAHRLARSLVGARMRRQWGKVELARGQLAVVFTQLLETIELVLGTAPAERCPGG